MPLLDFRNVAEVLVVIATNDCFALPKQTGEGSRLKFEKTAAYICKRSLDETEVFPKQSLTAKS